jgi:hypothetical protein
VSVLGYIYVGDDDVERIAKRIEPFAGLMSRRDDDVYVSADGCTLVMATLQDSAFGAEVHVYGGDTVDEQRERTRAIFALLRSHGDVALEANHELDGEPLETFTPKHSAA